MAPDPTPAASDMLAAITANLDALEQHKLRVIVRNEETAQLLRDTIARAGLDWAARVETDPWAARTGEAILIRSGLIRPVLTTGGFR